jgi:hypothetical protein
MVSHYPSLVSSMIKLANTSISSFKDGGELEGPIGEVRNIFGKKKARDECARLTLEYLLQEKERRLSYGRNMMQGIVGGQSMAGVAVGQPIGGSKAIGSAVLKREREREVNGSESEEEGDEFEDAVEVFHVGT